MLSGTVALEGRVAWRHLRADHAAPWVKRLTWASLYTVVVGICLGLYAEFGLEAASPVDVALAMDDGSTALQRGFSTFAFLSVVLGALALIFAIFARFFSILSTIVIYAVLLGSMSLVVVPSLMSGLMSRLREQILDQKAHLLIEGKDGRHLADYAEIVDALSGLDGLVGVSPFVEGEVMILSGIDRDGAILRGIEPSLFAKASRIEDIMDEGSYSALLDPASIPRPSARFGPTSLSGLSVDEPPRDAAGTGRAQVQGSAAVIGGEEAEPPPSTGEPVTGEGEVDPAPSADDAAREDPATPRVQARQRIEATLAALEDEGEGWEDPVETLGLSDSRPRAEGAREIPSQAPDVMAAREAAGAAAGSKEAILDPILVGKELALELGLNVGSEAQLITPVGRMTPGGRVPGVLKVAVGGIFFSKMYEYDKKLIYAPLDTVQAFLRIGPRVSGIEIRLANVDALDAGEAQILAAIEALEREDLEVRTWEDLNRNLFAAMYLEKIAMFVALSFVVLVSAFGILTSNLMSVLERYEEIAIMKAMGASDRSIQLIFWAEGLCVGVLGGASGIGIGLLICWALARFGLPFEAIYYMHEVPVEVHWDEVALVGASVLVVVWLFTLYPARIAARMRPVDTLRLAD